MNDIPNTLPDSRETTILDAPDRVVKIRDLFGIDSDMEVPAFSESDERVPDLDPAYVFDPDTTLAVLAGFAHNRRVMVQGYHGTGKSTHIEQVAARLNWPCIRINLDAHISRIDLIGRDAIVLKRGAAGDRVPRGAASLGAADADRARVRRIRCRPTRCDVRDPARAGDRGQADAARPEPRDPAQAPGSGCSRPPTRWGWAIPAGLYHGTQQINQGQMDRWNIVVTLNYLPAAVEARIVLAKSGEYDKPDGKKTVDADGPRRRHDEEGLRQRATSRP